MIKAHQFLFFVFILGFSSLNAQNSRDILIANKWSAYDDFAIIDFEEDGNAVVEYVYCSYCKGNRDTVDWRLKDNLLLLGKDSLNLTSINAKSIQSTQYGHQFELKNINQLKEKDLKKEAVKAFLITDTPLSVKVVSNKFDNSTPKSIQFYASGKMWLDKTTHRGQWALKSFYGQLFLIYLNRNAVNRNFPALKLTSLKKGKLIGQPIPSITIGRPFVLEIK